MKPLRWIVAVLLAGSLSAKDIEQRLPWQNLPQSLVGQKLEVLQTDNKRVSGRLIRIEPNGLVLEHKKGPITIPRANTSRLETKTYTRTRGRIIGVAVGASLGIVLTSIAVTYKHNEGGSNSDALVGAAVGIAVGGAVAGYFAGSASDADHTIIYVTPN